MTDHPVVTRALLLKLGLGVTLLTGAAVLILSGQRRPAWLGSEADGQRILVAPFRVDSSPRGWLAQVFAESLAARLRIHPGVDARAGSARAGEADYVVDGDVTTREGRAVIAIRVRPEGQRAAMWSATFWRENLADPQLAGDLALAIAEALGLPSAKGKAAGDTAR